MIHPAVCAYSPTSVRLGWPALSTQLAVLRCVPCTALHCTALHCTALHCTALHCTALHCRLGGVGPYRQQAEQAASPGQHAPPHHPLAVSQLPPVSGQRRCGCHLQPAACPAGPAAGHHKFHCCSDPAGSEDAKPDHCMRPPFALSAAVQPLRPAVSYFFRNDSTHECSHTHGSLPRVASASFLTGHLETTPCDMCTPPESSNTQSQKNKSILHRRAPRCRRRVAHFAVQPLQPLHQRPAAPAADGAPIHLPHGNLPRKGASHKRLVSAVHLQYGAAQHRAARSNQQSNQAWASYACTAGRPPS